MPKTPIYLITGFLGSGKTTFLKQAIDFFNGKKKVAIVQNEFAPGNFDGKELKRITDSDFDLLEINNGSVFCVCLLSGFIGSLKNFIQKYNPDIILLEASGLADPVSIGQIVNAPELNELVYLSGTICIVDANNFGKYNNLLLRIKHQIMIADYILINKSDLNADHETILSKIKEINPFGKTFSTTFCNAPLEEILQPASGANKKKQFFSMEGSGRPDINSAVFRTTKPLKADYLELFLQQITAKSLRLKGYILLDTGKGIAIQSVLNELYAEQLNFALKQTEIIVMGEEIDVRLVKQLYTI